MFLFKNFFFIYPEKCLRFHDCTAFLRQFMFIVAQMWPVVVSVAYLHIWTVEPKQTEIEIFLTWNILWLNKGKKVHFISEPF